VIWLTLYTIFVLMIGLLYQFPSWMQRMYRGVTWRRHGTRVVYLTFDDGVIPEVTPAILDILRDEQVKATFFVVGDNVRKYPDIYRRLIAEGHRVGNHTMHHTKGTKVSLSEYMADVEACQNVLGEGRSNLFRPPYGKMTFAQKRALLDAGYEIILWDVLTHDYNPRFSPEKMLRIVQTYTRDGSIINFHDSVKSGERTIAALPMVIRWLKENGWRMEVL